MNYGNAGNAVYDGLAIGENRMATKKKTTDGEKTPAQEKRSENSHQAFARSTSFSTRLTPEQRELIEEAAQLKGWTASKLIRLSSVERAANIVNMRGDQPGPLGQFVTRVGRQLFDTRLDYLDEHLKPVPDRKARRQDILVDEGELDGDSEADDDGARSVVPECFSCDDLVLLQSAIRLGGAEFMELVIQWGEHFKSGRVTRVEYREYIDPISMETSRLSNLEQTLDSPGADRLMEWEGAMEDLEEEDEPDWAGHAPVYRGG
jgi:hypothetical protein